MFKVHQNDASSGVLLLTLSKPCSSVSIVNFEHVIATHRFILIKLSKRKKKCLLTLKLAKVFIRCCSMKITRKI